MSTLFRFFFFIPITFSLFFTCVLCCSRSRLKYIVRVGFVSPYSLIDVPQRSVLASSVYTIYTGKEDEKLVFNHLVCIRITFSLRAMYSLSSFNFPLPILVKILEI